jgi:hypothetical protein
MLHSDHGIEDDPKQNQVILFWSSPRNSRHTLRKRSLFAPESSLELLQSAVALADTLIATPPAAVLGQRGGIRTAERGPDYYAKIASMRKTRAGGRPRKDAE